MHSYDTPTIQQKRWASPLRTEESSGDTESGEGQKGTQNETGAGTFIAYIYCLQCPKTGAIRYVGKTINPTQRLVGHLSKSHFDYKSHWIQSLKEEGLKPSLEILEEICCQTDMDWQEAEIFWISYLRFLGCNLCNLSTGGFGGPMQNAEARKKISAALKNRVFSPEHRAALSKAGVGRVLPGGSKLKGRKHPPEFGAKVSAANKGKKKKPLSPEHIALLVACTRARTWSEESRDKLRNRVISTETREKMRAAKAGKKLSLEHRQKLSAAQRARVIREGRKPRTPNEAQGSLF